MKIIFLQYGLAIEILSDGGGEFYNDVSQELYRILGVKKLKITSRQPRTNCAIEMWHRTLDSLLTNVINEHHDWAKYLQHFSSSLYLFHSHNAVK